MICEVIVDIVSSNVDKIFDYYFEDNLNYKVGQRVLVPFGARNIEGYILKIKDKSNVDSSKLKSIIKSLDDFSYLNDETIDLMNFLIKTYNLRFADCLRLFVPNVIRKNVKEKFVKFAFLSQDFEQNFENFSKKFNEKQTKIIEFLQKNGQFELSQLNVLFSPSSVKTLIKNGVISISNRPEKRLPYQPIKQTAQKPITLTNEQQNAVDTIIQKSPHTFLLFGVTASGKTEVYIKVIEQALKLGKTAILLVPEIGLTPQLFKRFTSVFGDLVAIIHSGLSDGEKLDEWLKIKRGQARVVIGARSAIFAPLENIGVIIIDEEHDTSYYSETNPRYYAKLVAEFRAKHNGASLVLGSATPSIETYYRAKQGEIELIEMKQRAVAKKLPQIFVVDMMRE
ncbi:MAG: primosomal protein N', partial [Christensenellales bacterium]